MQILWRSGIALTVLMPMLGACASAPVMDAGTSEALQVEVLRVDPTLDVALVRAMGWTPAADPLPIRPESDRLGEGQAVILIEFPAGLDAVLSKLSVQEYSVLSGR